MLYWQAPEPMSGLWTLVCIMSTMIEVLAERAPEPVEKHLIRYNERHLSRCQGIKALSWNNKMVGNYCKHWVYNEIVWNYYIIFEFLKLGSTSPERFACTWHICLEKWYIDTSATVALLYYACILKLFCFSFMYENNRMPKFSINS